jgi:hypothetical protein
LDWLGGDISTLGHNDMVAFKQGTTGSLNGFEKKIVKLLFEKKWRNQDILAFVNQCRPVTVNPGRKRWSRKFGPGVKMDCMTKVTIQNEETKEPFTRV